VQATTSVEANLTFGLSELRSSGKTDRTAGRAKENQNFALRTDQRTRGAARGAAAEPRPERTTEPRNKDLEVLCATLIRKNESVRREKNYQRVATILITKRQNMAAITKDHGRSSLASILKTAGRAPALGERPE
jgi:hypothetical protein